MAGNFLAVHKRNPTMSELNMKLVSVLETALSRHRLAGIALFALALSGAGAANETASNADVFTTRESGADAYSITVTELADDQRQFVSSGRRMIDDLWVLPTEVTGVWGVGPTFNENSCQACHEKNGRARAPDDSKEITKGLLLRLSVPGDTETGAPRPHPNYGSQFQNRGVRKVVPAEGKAFVNYEPVIVEFADGEQISLRKPVVKFTRLAFGELGETTMISARIAPSLVGLGLLEAIPEETVLAIAEQQLAQGLNGKPNYVWDHESGQTVLGRFGWKANQPSLLQQTAAAFHGDIGATSSMFPVENCPAVQTKCIKGPTATGCSGGHVKCNDTMSWEVFPSRLRNVTRYLQALAVPAQRNADDSAVLRGKELFSGAQCDGCHVPELKTGNTPQIAAAANLTILPYTDLLLHDMGEGLADHRPDFQASGRQWRTPPLWGLGLQKTVNGHTDLLHDGRARGFVEAIVWHDGEAQRSRDRFLEMDKHDREALVKFLESI
jgi:CxxC motif-containing protein (DUF1111 family)